MVRSTMAEEFDKILDECIDRVNRGDTIAACLKDHPQHAADLEPMLQMMFETKQAYVFTPSEDAKRQGRQRLYAAIDRRKASFWQRLFTQKLAIATIAAVIVLVVAGYAGLRATILSPRPLTIISATPSTAGNFAFLVTDEVNAIGDFSQLNITLQKINLLQKDSPDKWVEFVPETRQFDLTLLPNGKTQQLWQGNIPEGQYSAVVIYVSEVQGLLKASGNSLNIKLPSNKLQITKVFEVEQNITTSFVYDLTVVKAGNAKNGEKYLLKPQIDTSGATQSPQSEQTPDTGKGKPEKTR
jgi:hypothetical protein